jgi:hypothetical protein
MVLRKMVELERQDAKAASNFTIELGFWAAGARAPTGVRDPTTAEAAAAGAATTTEVLAKQAKTMVDELKAARKPIVVNLAGTGEVADAINVNSLKAQQVRNIPRLLAVGAEKVGDVFESGVVDKVVSNNVVRGEVNWSEALKGAFKILKSGGKVTIAPYAGELEAQLAEIATALREAGFKNIIRDPVTKLFYTAVK